MAGPKYPHLYVLLALVVFVLVHPSENSAAFGASRFEEDEYYMRMNVTSAPLSFHGETDGSNFGSSISGEGDVNGDGLCDLLIGSPWNDENGTSSGRIDLFLGGRVPTEGCIGSSMSNVRFLGTASGDQAGTSAEIAGDLNGDGIDDIVICDRHSHHPSCRGSAAVFLGRVDWCGNMSLETPDMTIATDSSCPGADLKVARCGDFNNDGYDDIFLSNTDANPNGMSDAGKAYLFFGGRDIWNATRSLEGADSSIEGNAAYDYFGSSISGLGDINGDGFDDVIIGAQGVNYGSPDSGRAYVFFGRASGPGRNVSCGSADVFLNGEDAYGSSGWSVSGGKDVNGDGVNDVAIGAPFYSDDAGSYPRGKVHIILGKAGTWPQNIDLKDADASILGEEDGDYLGQCVDLAGDMDGDGCSELLIGAPYSWNGGYYLGQAYLIKGRGNDWGKDLNISSISYASFIGEGNYDYCGMMLKGIGDIDMDGGPDIGISSPFNDHIAPNGGSVYVFPGMVGFPPKQVHSVEIFLDEDMTEPAIFIDRGEQVFLRLLGTDGNSSSINSALVNLSLCVSHPVPSRLVLRETGKDTGTYTGRYIIPLTAEWNEELLVVSLDDFRRSDSVRIDTPVRMEPRTESLEIKEGDVLDLSFRNVGWSGICLWDFETDSDWMEWDASEHRVSGAPNNGHVGAWSAKVRLSDGSSHSDELDIEVQVENVQPVITNGNIVLAEEDVPYIVDYSCDEDMEGGMVWGFATNGSFLEMISDAGILRGTPGNDDVGDHWVRVWVDDGNGGTALTRFNLTVVNVNDPPFIMSQDITKVDQGIRYRNRYEAEDPDEGDTLTWTLDTDAEWLSMNGSTLSGTPGPEDVGEKEVTVTVTDRAGATDVSSFRLMVENVNDPPSWTDVPDDLSTLNGASFRFDVNATDPDLGTELSYSISSLPFTDISIDRSSGLISWSASIDFFERPPYLMTVKVKVTDGTVTIEHDFKVTVLLSGPPTSVISYPSDGSRVPFKGSFLEWSASDPDGDELTYDIYIGENKALVSLLHPDTSFIEGLEGTRLEMGGLQQGKTYYWTVIPFDGCSRGTCSNKVLSFRLNSPPRFKDVEVQQAKAGQQFRLLLKVTDDDLEDRANLRFHVKEGPAGLSIDGETGILTWTPSGDQAMLHRIVAVVNDSVETSEIVLTIEVLPEDSGASSPSVLIVAGTSMMAFAAAGALAAFIIIRKRRSKDENGEGLDPEVERGSEEGPEGMRNLCSVALDATEAHRNDQRSKAPMSYEELYGMPAPEKPECRSTAELRDHIKGAIEELEGLDGSEGALNGLEE